MSIPVRPYVSRVCTYVQLQRNGDATDGDESALCTVKLGEHVVTRTPKPDEGATHVAVVLAAHCAGRACAAGTADDGDGGAFQADEDVQVREDDAEQAEDRSRARVSSLGQ